MNRIIGKVRKSISNVMKYSLSAFQCVFEASEGTTLRFLKQPYNISLARKTLLWVNKIDRPDERFPTNN